MFFYLYFLEKNIKLQTDITLSTLKIFVDSSKKDQNQEL